ncbi:MAG: serpin family protein [Gemmatimonadaceae bacterium]
MSFTRNLAAASVALIAACSSNTEPGPGTQAAPLENLPRQLTAGEQTVVGAANDFSFGIFRQIAAANKDSNAFTSPLSASMALGMTLNGAASSTYSQMKSTLGFGSASDADINASYKSLIALLRALDPSVDFRVANSIWYRSGFPFEQSFVDVSKASFDATVTGLDFSNPSAVTSINDWVSTATAAKIPKIIDKIDNDQVMFLINAIYFKGSWRDKFDPAETKDDTFHGVAGDQPMKLMHRAGTLRLLSNQQFTAADLPYGNSAYAMTVLLPNPGTTVDQLAASLQSGAWTTWMGQFQELKTAIWLPRLKLEWQRDLNDDLKAMGMRNAFIPDGADFTRMSSTQGTHLFIDKVKQKTFVDINEEGTEAAAVTSVGISVTSLPPSLRVDRPFIFVIRERLSGTILFMGKIVRMP